jgi:hypothetical protein
MAKRCLHRWEAIRTWLSDLVGITSGSLLSLAHCLFMRINTFAGLIYNDASLTNQGNSFAFL